MNRTPKAIEIRLSEPIASAAKPAVSMNPAISVATMAPTSFKERIAANRIAHTATIEITVARKAPSRNVANCSSSSAIWPVSRSCTPFGGAMPSSPARRRISARALPPGSRPVKSSTGRVKTKRRSSRGSGFSPVIICCQERLCGFPSNTPCTTSPIAASVASSCSIAAASLPECVTKRASASNRPRRLGSWVRLPISGCAEISCCVTFSSSSVGRNNSPF